MDDTIARQKIAKRRPAPKPSPAKAAFQYPQREARPIYAWEFRKNTEAGPRRRRGLEAQFPWLRLRSWLRFRSNLALELRQNLRSLLRRASGHSTTSLALFAAAGLAFAIALCVGAAALIRGPSFPLPSSGLLPAEDSIQALLLDYASPELAGVPATGDQDSSPLPPAPVTLELSTYTMRSGDSLSSVARRFGLYADTLISVNGISNSSGVRAGTQLRIPNINGLIYKAKSGDNLAAIAKRFKIDTTRIVDANDLRSWRLLAGQSLFIPGARLPESAVKQALGQRVSWPLRGPLSSFFGYRPDPFTGIRRFHAGIDIVTDTGTPVMAAMDGRVSDSGYNANYGNYVILNHAGGFQTLYGHLSSAGVALGAKIAQGSMIGVSGNTGYSTGPHLHFGLFRQGLPLNPLKFLK